MILPYMIFHVLFFRSSLWACSHHMKLLGKILSYTYHSQWKNQWPPSCIIYRLGILYIYRNGAKHLHTIITSPMHAKFCCPIARQFSAYATMMQITWLIKRKLLIVSTSIVTYRREATHLSLKCWTLWLPMSFPLCYLISIKYKNVFCLHKTTPWVRPHTHLYWWTRTI